MKIQSINKLINLKYLLNEKMMYHEIRIIDKRVEEVGGLDEFEAFVSERDDAAIEADSCRPLVFYSCHQI